jgi:hypothetical protein
MVIAHTNWNQSCRQFYQHQVQKFVKAVFPLAKFSVIMPMTLTHYRQICVLSTKVENLGWQNTKLIWSYLFRIPQGGQGKLALSPTNVAKCERTLFLKLCPLAKFSAIALVTVPHDSLYVTSFGHIGQCDTNRNDPIYVMLPKVAQASTVTCYCLANNLW